MKTQKLPRQILPALLLCLVGTSPLTAQLKPTEQITARRDDGGELIHDPALSWSEGNYHVLHNGVEVLYSGLGAGGLSTPGLDGIGTFIPGEELRGNCVTSLGDFGYRQTGFRETVAVLDQPGGTYAIKFPHIVWVELDGANGHAPVVFTNPTDNNCSISSLGVGATPYGAPAGETSFINASSPVPPFQAMVIPNENVLSGGGTATIIAELQNVVIPIMDSASLWEVQFEWITPLESKDDIDGWYHWAASSPDDNQYFGFSNDELNLWHSYTVGTEGSLGSILSFTANLDYGLFMLSKDPTTHAALAPVGPNGTGAYYSTTTPGILNLNGGFDLGRGSQMVSFSGVSGVTNLGGGLGNQDPAGSPSAGLLPTLGFVTYDNTDYDGDGDLVSTPPLGSDRLTWVAFDLDVSFGIDPALAGDATVNFGTCRAPVSIPVVPGGPWPEPITRDLFPLLLHTTAPGPWPDPGGFGASPSEFGVPLVMGSSAHIPLSGTVCVAGIPLALQYGSSGLVTPTGPLTWNPAIAALSGTRQIFLFD